MCSTFGTLPVPGGVLEQPWGLLLVMADMLGYSKAYALYSEDSDHASPEVKKIVLETLAASLRV